MDLTSLLFVFSVIFLAVVVGLCVAALVASVPPENRPAPLPRTADLERQRDELMNKLAERSRQQRQQREREAAARISRGF